MLETINKRTYNRFRKIIDRANGYWQANATFSRGGWSSLDADKAKHKDYSACTNDMRGQVEQYEILRDKPDKLSAYIGSDGQTVTVWTGQPIGKAEVTGKWRVNSWIGSHMYSYRVTIAGKRYKGRGFGAGMCINLYQSK